MNILSLHNQAFLESAKLSNDSLEKIAGQGNKLDIGEKENVSFVDMMKTEIDNVNTAQLKADDMTNKFMIGEIDDLHSVMISTEEARISLELAVQVRNKIIEAYKEINNMQL